MKAKEETWRRKLQPVFFEAAEVLRYFEVEFRRITTERDQAVNAVSADDSTAMGEALARYVQQARGLFKQVTDRYEDINRRFGVGAHNERAYHYLDPPVGVTERGGFMDLARYLHWMRHRESLADTTKRDVAGDLDAWTKLTRTGEDFRRVVHGKGPIKPFQGDTVHRELLELILCYEKQPLTAEERADCLDAYCACGRSHDADAVKKQFARLKTDLGSK